MSEMDKLEKYLLAHGYEYNRIEGEGDEVVFRRHQIIVYKDGKRQWDAICQRGSYGYEHGLLEIYGNIVWESDGDSVVGWLTAEDVIRRIEINLWDN